MKLKVQKRIAADIFKCSKKRVVFDNDRKSDIKEAITKADLRGLIQEKAIKKLPKRGVSRVRARKRHVQRTKGRQKGKGKRKGTAKARTPKKRVWINKIRLQRSFLQELKGKGLVTIKVFRELYMKAKGGFFRSRKHLKNYVEEHKLFVKPKKSEKGTQ